MQKTELWRRQQQHKITIHYREIGKRQKKNKKRELEESPNSEKSTATINNRFLVNKEKIKSGIKKIYKKKLKTTENISFKMYIFVKNTFAKNPKRQIH